MSSLFVTGEHGIAGCVSYLVWCGQEVRQQSEFKTDLRWVTKHADVVVLLPGWEQSRSAVCIKMVAENYGLPVVYYHADRLHGDRIHEFAVETPVAQPTGLGEIRVVNQVTGGEKGRKPARFELIPPVPLAVVAEVYGRGAEKYADRNWERGVDWSLMFGAMMRHMWLWWAGETNDEESGLNHLGHAAFHVLGLLQLADTHPGLDDRPKLNE